MRVKDFGGRPATNRVGAAEYLGLPLNTVRMYSSPAQRPRRGWPEPAPRELVVNDTAREEDWFYLDELDALRPQHGLQPSQVEEPDRLLDLAEFAALRGISTRTAQNYVEDSIARWEQGLDGTLPTPDEIENASHGKRYRWRHHRAVAWTFPARARRSPGRPPGRRPTIDDLRSVLAAHGQPDALTANQIADKLGELIGSPVSARTVQRLRAELAGKQP